MLAYKYTLLTQLAVSPLSALTLRPPQLTLAMATACILFVDDDSFKALHEKAIWMVVTGE